MEQDHTVKRPDCFQCAHFTITWDPKRPRACRLFGFKTPGLPSALVFSSTGAECTEFVRKTEEHKKA